MNKIYKKRGNLNYKEKKLVAQIEKTLKDKYGQDYIYKLNDLNPASNFDQLQRLHNEVTTDAEDVEFEVVEEAKEESTEERQEIPKQEPITENKAKMEDSFIDPLNREERIVRDYVLHADLPKESDVSAENIKSEAKVDFAEPISFEEAFEIPDDKNNSKAKAGNSNNKFSNMGGKGNPNKNTPPINPDYDTMSGDFKRKKTRKFAKYIVELTCAVSEKGLVLWANRNITEEKLAEYELSGEIDLSFMITLSENQQVTIREFFVQQRLTAEEITKFDKEEKEDLVDALVDVMLEKGVAPTPTQQLIIVALTSFGRKAVGVFAINNQINSLLNQLREMSPKTQPKRAVKQQPIQQQPIQEEEPIQQEEIKSQPIESVVVEEVVTAESIFEGPETKE